MSFLKLNSVGCSALSCVAWASPFLEAGSLPMREILHATELSQSMLLSQTISADLVAELYLASPVPGLKNKGMLLGDEG